MHRVIPIKVNAMVDEGVAELVSALSELPGLITLDSCQENEWGCAHVYFRYGTDWPETAALLQEVSTLLSEAGLPCGYSLKLEWLGSNNTPHAQVSLRPEHVADLALGLRRITPELKGRMRALRDDRQGTVLGNSPACPDHQAIPA